MLKTRFGEAVICVTQPDHAAVSGYLAAHWGNEVFTRLGGYAPVDDPARLRAEVVFAVAEHDNGWWLWEATAPLASIGGDLPPDLIDMDEPLQATADRWRMGIERYRVGHPYAALLISQHAVRLLTPWADTASKVADRLAVRRFLDEVHGLQTALRTTVAADPARRAWLDDRQILPHMRLVQVLDAVSLGLCSKVIQPETGQARGLGRDRLVFGDVPRRSWDDRVTMTMEPVGDRRISVTPYPFDRMPLPAIVRSKRVASTEPDALGSAPSWYATPPSLLDFTLVAG